VTGAVASADLSITKTASSPVIAGSAMTYTVTVANNGPSPAQNVTVVDTLPSGVGLSTTGGAYTCALASNTLTCTLANLGNGATAVLTINATAPATAGTITNTATVSSSTTDPATANNSASVTSTVGAAQQPTCPSVPASPLTPANNSTGVSHSVTFTWSPVSTAIGYTVLGNVDGGPLQDFGSTGATVTTLQVSLTGSNVIWFVRARFTDCPTIDSTTAGFQLEAPDSCELHVSPTLRAPLGGVTVGSSSVLLEWNAVARANAYRVWVSVENAPFAALETTQETSLQAAIPYGRVDWYVEALFPGCPATESTRATFNVPRSTSCGGNTPATLLSPANGSTINNRSVEFTWQAAANAIGYEVYLSVNSGTPTLIGSTTTATSLAANVAAGSLRWFVRALFSGCDPVNSPDFTFDFNPPASCPDARPILTAPGSNAVGLNSPVDFTWSASPRATQYRLRLSVDGGPVTELTTTATHLNNVVLPATGAVEWSVTAMAAGCPDLQSTVGSFALAPPPPACSTPETTALRAAANASSAVDYLVRWDPIPGAVSYEIQESPRSDFATASITNVTDTEQSFRHSNDNTGVTAYFFYRVRGVNSCNATRGQYSESIAVGILPVKATTTPNPTGATPVDNPQTTTYQMQICTTAGPSCSFVGAVGQSFTASTDQTWLTVSPSSGIVPAGGIILTATANASGLGVGTNTAAVNVVFTSPGSTSGGKTGQQSSSSRSTSNVSVNLVAPVAPTPSNTPPPDALIIPAVAHAAGLNSQFESDIRVTNTSPQPMKYQLTFTPTGETGITEGKQTTIDIDPGKTVALDDVLDTWFGAGANATGASGALEIRPLTKSSTSVSSSAQSGLPNIVTFAMSRTFSVAGNGSMGTIVPAIPYANFIGKSLSAAAPSILSLQQISQNASQRTNFGLKEGSGQPATVLVSIFGSNGQRLGEFTQNLTGGQHLQINSMLARQNLNNVADGRIEVQVMSATGKVTAYASVLNNDSNDAQLVSPVSLSQNGSAKFVLPGVADLTNDAGKTQTDVRLFNASSNPVTATLNLFTTGSTQPQSQQITLAANEVKSLDNVIQATFGQTNIGAAALHVTTAAPANLIATARTYVHTAAGTLGQFMSAVTPSNAITLGSRPLQLLQVEESNRFSTDVGIAEISGKSVDLEITIIPQDSKISAKTTVSLGPNQFLTMNHLLQQVGLDNSYNTRVAVRVVNGAGAATAYASVTDKATNDLTFVPAQ
jgi:uncharacterized repeat protein (TIGR01451 family)